MIRPIAPCSRSARSDSFEAYFMICSVYLSANLVVGYVGLTNAVVTAMADVLDNR